MSATVASTKDAGVQVGAAPAMSTTKLRRISLPRGVWATSGWNWMPYSPRSVSASPAKAVESLWAVGTKPSGGRTIESPWLIQTGCSRSMPRKRPSSDVIWTDAGPYSRLALGTTSPPSSWAISCSP